MDVTSAALDDIGRKVTARLVAEPPQAVEASLVFDVDDVDRDTDGPESRELTPEEYANAVVVGGVPGHSRRRGVRRQVDMESYHRAVADIAAERARQERLYELDSTQRTNVNLAMDYAIDPDKAAALVAYTAAAQAMHAAEVAHHEAVTKANATLEEARKPYAEAWAAFNRSILGVGTAPPKE